MSLVGSEVDITTNDDQTMTPPHSPVRDDHPPLTPPSAAERMFLDNLSTDTISAAALAQQIHSAHRAGSTVYTDDFASAAEADTLHPLCYSPEDDDDDDTDELLLETPVASKKSLFAQDALYQDLDFQDKSCTPVFHDSKMSSDNTAATTIHVDAAEKVYEGAKNVWAWGKGIIVFKPFLGLAEGVAGKVVQMAGSDFEHVDGHIVQHLHGIDDKLLNPAIEAVLNVVLNAAHKTEDIIKPVLFAVLKPVGLIKEQGEPEVTGTDTAIAAK